MRTRSRLFLVDDKKAELIVASNRWIRKMKSLANRLIITQSVGLIVIISFGLISKYGGYNSKTAFAILYIGMVLGTVLMVISHIGLIVMVIRLSKFISAGPSKANNAQSN